MCSKGGRGGMKRTRVRTERGTEPASDRTYVCLPPWTLDLELPLTARNPKARGHSEATLVVYLNAFITPIHHF